MSHRLRELSDKFAEVKFLEIKSRDAIPDYPDSNCPTLLIYRDDELILQLVGLEPLGGESMTAGTVYG